MRRGKGEAGERGGRGREGGGEEMEEKGRSGTVPAAREGCGTGARKVEEGEGMEARKKTTHG